MNVDSTISIQIDPQRVRQNAADIRSRVGVAVHAVVKANAYGLGVARIVPAIKDVVDGFCVFDLHEAREVRKLTEKPILCLGPPGEFTANDFLAIKARPAVSTVDEAKRLGSASCVLCVDTGMQRFACPAELVGEAVAAGNIGEAFTHAVRPEQVKMLLDILGPLRGLMKVHAAASALLADANYALDGVRPGLALYRGAVRISARLVEVRETRGPIGYGSFSAPRVGVILLGYSHGLRPGPCLVNGSASRVLECGMQSSFIDVIAGDRVGDEVVLLGDGLEAEQIATEWKTSAQEVLVSLLRTNRVL